MSSSVSCPACLTLVRTAGLTHYRGFLTCPACGNRFFASIEDDAAAQSAKSTNTAAISASEIAAALAELPGRGEGALGEIVGLDDMEIDEAEQTREATGRIEPDIQSRIPARLRVLGTNRVMPLEKFRFVIGRSGSDFAVDDPAISRQHAAIENHSEKFLLKDLGSTNGTYLNGKRVTVEFLNPGDVIQAGKIKLRFETTF